MFTYAILWRYWEWISLDYSYSPFTDNGACLTHLFIEMEIFRWFSANWLVDLYIYCKRCRKLWSTCQRCLCVQSLSEKNICSILCCCCCCCNVFAETFDEVQWITELCNMFVRCWSFSEVESAFNALDIKTKWLLATLLCALCVRIPEIHFCGALYIYIM